MKRTHEIFGLVALIALTVCSTKGHAAEFSLTKGEGFDIIAISGQIAVGDEDHFRRLAVGSDKALVVLNSPGGSLVPALDIGKTIQLKGFNTYVGKESFCTSSCALIWIAGSKRFLSASAHIGFHASYRDNDGRNEEVGMANAIIGRYLTLLNLPEKAVIFATSAPPSSVLWLDRSNSDDAGISFEIFDLPGPKAPDGVSSHSSVQATSAQPAFEWKKGFWDVKSYEQRCIASESFDSEGSVKNSSFFGITREFSGGSSLMFVNEKFRSLIEGKLFKLSMVFSKNDKLDTRWGVVNFTSVKLLEQNGFDGSFKWDDLRTSLINNEKVGFFDGKTLVDLYPLTNIVEVLSQLDICLNSRKPVLADPFAR